VPNEASVGDFSVRFEMVTGTVTSGSALNTWLSLSSARHQYVEAPVPGTKSADIRVQVRFGSGSALENQVFTVAAEAL
jgi:hypothetical protein